MSKSWPTSSHKVLQGTLHFLNEKEGGERDGYSDMEDSEVRFKSSRLLVIDTVSSHAILRVVTSFNHNSNYCNPVIAHIKTEIVIPEFVLCYVDLLCNLCNESFMSLVSESSGRRSSSHRNSRVARNLSLGYANSVDAGTSFIPSFSAAASEGVKLTVDEDNWAENTTVITGNTSEHSYSGLTERALVAPVGRVVARRCWIRMA
ncbi:unnamed protein product [Onchocerca flexuosa]|uniref:Uncharacterized protein n=1 Tax=Onchocerca flexuosa TaxID=387005 RepID=A0A183HYN0_9BILA|nr:unnamed protein product [Onchocerca flexuosa]